MSTADGPHTCTQQPETEPNPSYHPLKSFQRSHRTHSNMHAWYTIATFFAAAFAAPAAVAPSAETDDTLIRVELKANAEILQRGLESRQEQCNVEYCQPLYNSCIVSCDSLSNGDWYALESRVWMKRPPLLINIQLRCSNEPFLRRLHRDN